VDKFSVPHLNPLLEKGEGQLRFYYKSFSFFKEKDLG